MSFIERFLQGSRTGCQYRWNPISYTSFLPCHGIGICLLTSTSRILKA